MNPITTISRWFSRGPSYDESKPTPILTRMNPDGLRAICMYLDNRDLVSLGRTCRELHERIETECRFILTNRMMTIVLRAHLSDGPPPRTFTVLRVEANLSAVALRNRRHSEERLALEQGLANDLARNRPAHETRALTACLTTATAIPSIVIVAPMAIANLTRTGPGPTPEQSQRMLDMMLESSWD